MWILGLKGLQNFSDSDPPTSRGIRATASERNEGKTFVRRGYVLCANDDLPNLILFTYIHCQVSFTFLKK